MKTFGRHEFCEPGIPARRQRPIVKHRPLVVSDILADHEPCRRSDRCVGKSDRFGQGDKLPAFLGREEVLDHEDMVAVEIQLFHGKPWIVAIRMGYAVACCFFRRQAYPAIPAMPMPSRVRLAGSGTVAGPIWSV